MCGAHTNVGGSKLDQAVKNVKRQRRNVILAILVDILSPMTCAKMRPQCLFGSGGEVFLKLFTIYRHGGHLRQRTATILAISGSPAQRSHHMKFEQYWPNGYRREFIGNSPCFSRANTNAQGSKLDLAVKISVVIVRPSLQQLLYIYHSR